MGAKGVMERILEKGIEYRYNSMEYTDAEDLEGASLIINTEDYIFVLKELEDKNRLYWAARSKHDFLRGISILRDKIGKDNKIKPIYMEFVPEEFISELEALGFKMHSEFLDFWKLHLEVENDSKQFLYKIRPITGDEYSAASKITKACKDLSRGFRGETEDFVKEWSEAENSIVLAAEDNEELIGVCFLNLYGFESERGTVLWLRELAVDPKYHSKGIGGALIRAAIAWGIEKGAKRSFLACDTENYNAIKLYESYGYKKRAGRGQINMIEKLGGGVS